MLMAKFFLYYHFPFEIFSDNVSYFKHVKILYISFSKNLYLNFLQYLNKFS